MKDMREFQGLGGFTSTSKFLQIQFYLLLLLGMMGTGLAWGQAPGLIWSTSAGANLFSVDAQGNVYGSTNGTIKVLNSSGALVQTTNFCPVPGLVQRDTLGNYYYAGSFAGSVNFGGVTLIGGYFSGGILNSNFPTCYVAKYATNGSLLWATPFGSSGPRDRVDDLAFNADGSINIALDESGNPKLAQFSTTGTNLWETSLTPNFILSFRITGFAGTNGTYMLYADPQVATGFYDALGNSSRTFESNGITFTKNPLSWNGRAISQTNHDIVYAILSGDNPSDAVPYLIDSQAGSFTLSAQPIGPVEQWVVGGDGKNTVYLAGVDGSFSEYLSDGTQIWTTNYGAPVAQMIIDPQGGRYISTTNGTIAKLAADISSAPAITNAPVGGTVFVGDDFTFSVGVSGNPPFIYQWFYESNALATAVPVTGATDSTLSFAAITANQDGFYSVVISNAVNSVTSAPVRLQVKSVEVYAGTNILDAGSYSFSSPPTLTIRSAFTNGEVFYTLDGSTPSFTSTPYSKPFVLSANATINAIGYSSDFSQSALADPVIATVPAQFTLFFSTPGGGTIAGQEIGAPAGSVQDGSQFPSNAVVNFVAIPAPGFTFLGWQGTIVSSSTNLSVRMNHNQNLTAIFGTTLSTAITGNGQVLLSPPAGPYAYGTVVRLEARPQPGNAFGAWGNAAAGSSTSPLNFTVTNALPVVSAIFAPTPANQASLTVLIVGNGQVTQNIPGNSFPTNTTVSLLEQVGFGAAFSGWTGSFVSFADPLIVPMTQDRVVIANFSGQSASLGSNGIVSLGQGRLGFQFTIMGEPQSVLELQTSTNLTSWQDAAQYTNDTGELQLISPPITNSATFYRVKFVTP